jgi:nicotinamidase-related amidase
MAEQPPLIDPRRAALLVMDYQAGIVDSLPGVDALLSRVAAAIAIARVHEVQIAYVRVAFTAADYAAIPATNRSFSRMAGRAGAMAADAPQTAVHSRLAPRAGDIVVRKTRVGAFATTNLDARLRDQQIDTLLLAGFATSGVVLSTVRDAADRDYRLIVLSDACADRDPEVHELLMEKVFPRQAYVIAISNLPELLRPAR